MSETYPRVDGFEGDQEAELDEESDDLQPDNGVLEDPWRTTADVADVLDQRRTVPGEDDEFRDVRD